ncbi:MAG: peptidylprolyl isomerase [Myxococcota bacterium]
MSRPRWVVWSRNVVVALIVLAFVGFFGQPNPGPGADVVAEVDGVPIPRAIFEFFRAQNEGLLRELGNDLDPGAFGTLLDSQTLSALVRRYVISREATDLGLRASEREIRAEILADPGFRRDGRFDRELFERFVVRTGLESDRSYTREIERDLLMQKFQRAVSSPVRVSTAAVEDELRRSQTRVQTQLAVARPDAFRGRVEVTDVEIAAFAEASPAQVEAAYKRRKAEFVQPEEARVRHILLTGPEASTQAASARERAQAGEDFADLARELSKDLATREDGGDTGFFPRGRMLPPFEEAAFSLEPGTISEPVETARGVHLVRVEERREASERSLAEVTPELARDLLIAEGALETAKSAAQRMAELLREGSSFEDAATKAGLSLQTPAPFGWNDSGISGIGNASELRATALSLQEEDPSPRRVFEIDGGFALLQLVSREEPDEAAIGAEMAITRERLAEEGRTRLITRWFQTRRDALEQDGRLVVRDPSG